MHHPTDRTPRALAPLGVLLAVVLALSGAALAEPAGGAEGAEAAAEGGSKSAGPVAASGHAASIVRFIVKLTPAK